MCNKLYLRKILRAGAVLITLLVFVSASPVHVIDAQENEYVSVVEETLNQFEKTEEMPQGNVVEYKAKPVLESKDVLIENEGEAVGKKLIDVLEVKEMPIANVLMLIEEKSGLNIIADQDLPGEVTIYLRNVDAMDTLRIILDTNALAYSEEEAGLRIMTAEEFELKYGYPFGQEIQTKIVSLLYAKATQIIKILDQMKSNTGKIIYNNEDNTLVLMDSPKKLTMMADLIKELDVPLETEIFELKHIRAEDTAQEIKEALTKSVGRVQFDNRSNTIVVTDKFLKIQEIKKLIQTLDQQNREVQIQTKILQITLNDEHIMGVDWEAIVSNYQALKFPYAQGEEHVNETKQLSLGTISEEDFVILLEALETVGDINTISDFQTVTTFDEGIQIAVNPKERFVSSRRKEEQNVSSEPMMRLFVKSTLNRDFEDEDDPKLVLYVQPSAQIQASSLEETFNMAFDEAVAKAASKVIEEGFRKNGAAVDQEPKEASLKDIAKAKVQDGSTVVVGGLFKDVTVESMKKIPLLGNLPLLGFAFRHQGEQVRKTEVIVFITANIIVKE